MSRLYIFSALLFLMACDWDADKKDPLLSANLVPVFETVSAIPPPDGYHRINLDSNSFGQWLKNISLKKDNHVYLYNGSLKADQSAQFAVLDVSVGKKDLQQCADAILRLRTEYFFKQGQTNLIAFKATDGTALSFADWRNGTRYRLSGNQLVTYKQGSTQIAIRKDLDSFLEIVFSYCGTYSLQKETLPGNISGMQPGDILIKGGAPGHAMIIMDVAVNDQGKKVFMLAQSYMPAQDIHIVKNPANDKLSPWYEVDDAKQIITPQWIFSNDQFRRW